MKAAASVLKCLCESGNKGREIICKLLVSTCPQK